MHVFQKKLQQRFVMKFVIRKLAGCLVNVGVAYGFRRVTWQKCVSAVSQTVGVAV